MAQQISIEDAFPTFQKRCTELFEQNLVLTAQVDILTKQLDAARSENEQLKAAVSDPAAGGPDLAAVPPFPDSEQH